MYTILRVILPSLAFLLSAYGVPAAQPQPAEKSPQAPFVGLDGKFVQMTERLPGFGGMFFDENGVLTVYLVKADQRFRGKDVKAHEAQVRAALSAVFGEDFLMNKRRHVDREKKRLLKAVPDMNIIRREIRHSAAREVASEPPPGTHVARGGLHGSR